MSKNHSGLDKQFNGETFLLNKAFAETGKRIGVAYWDHDPVGCWCYSTFPSTQEALRYFDLLKDMFSRVYAEDSIYEGNIHYAFI